MLDAWAQGFVWQRALFVGAHAAEGALIRISVGQGAAGSDSDSGGGYCVDLCRPAAGGQAADGAGKRRWDHYMHNSPGDAAARPHYERETGLGTQPLHGPIV